MSYFEDYLEQIKILPSEVKRNFALIKELDQRCMNISEKVNQQSQAYFQSAKRLKGGADAEPPESKALYKEIKENQDQCTYLTDEKLVVIEQAEKEIDGFLLQIDKHIARFQNELREMGAEQKATQEESQSEPLISGAPKKRKTGQKFGKVSVIKKVRKTAEEGPYSIRLEAPIDFQPMDQPVEDQRELYCYCQQHREGEMVGCDNPNCKYKWFHFDCIGLTTAPKSDEEWYCPECTAKMQNKRK